jgi:hypothetical protein
MLHDAEADVRRSAADVIGQGMPKTAKAIEVPDETNHHWKAPRDGSPRRASMMYEAVLSV